jgi:hypothetical protein
MTLAPRGELDISGGMFTLSFNPRGELSILFKNGGPNRGFHSQGITASSSSPKGTNFTSDGLRSLKRSAGLPDGICISVSDRLWLSDTGLPDGVFSNQKIPIWVNFGGHHNGQGW